MECHAVCALQAGTQLPPLLEGDEATQEGDTSSADTAVQALSSQIVSSMDFGSGKPMAPEVCESMYFDEFNDMGWRHCLYRQHHKHESGVSVAQCCR